MTGENPILSFPCTIENIKEIYESVGLIQELDGYIIISIDGQNIYLVQSPIVAGMYIQITQDGKDLSDYIKSIDTFKGQVSLDGGTVNYDNETGALEKHGGYYVSYHKRDRSDTECKLYSCDNGVLKQEGVMLYNCNEEVKPFTFNGNDISRAVSGINVSQGREDTVVYKGVEFLFDQITGELRSWSGYAVKYEPNDQDTKKFYQLYDVSGDTAKKIGYIFINSCARNPESIFESVTSITLGGISISENIIEVKNQVYNGIEVKYKGVWLQLDEKTGVIKTYNGIPYGKNEEVTSVNARQHFYKLYNFDAEEPIVCGYGVGYDSHEFIPVTLNGKDISREVSNMFESEPSRDSSHDMTIHGRVHIEFEGIPFQLSPMTGEVVTLKGHPINLVEDVVNVYTLGDEGYDLEEEDNRFDITLNGKRIGGVLDYERLSYFYDIHALEIDGHRISVDNDTCELCNVIDSLGKQFVYCVYPHTVVYYFVNAGELTFIQDKQKIQELEGLRKGTLETITSQVNGDAMLLL